MFKNTVHYSLRVKIPPRDISRALQIKAVYKCDGGVTQHYWRLAWLVPSQEKVPLWETSARTSQHGKPLFTVSSNDFLQVIWTRNWFMVLMNLIRLSLFSERKRSNFGRLRQDLASMASLCSRSIRFLQMCHSQVLISSSAFFQVIGNGNWLIW